MPSKNEVLLKHYIEELRADPVVAAREVLGYDLAPHQRYALRGMWVKRWTMHIWGRGTGKTLLDAVFAALSAVLYPGEKVLVVGPGFRQAQFVFKEIENRFMESSVFRDSVSGIKHNTSEWSMEFKNGSVIYAVPLGNDGSKIRGYRANRLIIDEAVQVPPEIIDTVLLPFMGTSKNPLAHYLGNAKDETANMLVYTSSAYFTFNHMYKRFCVFLKEMFAEGNEDYFVTQFNYKDTPEGFCDMKVISLARKQATEADFQMEWEGEWVSDTTGFYPASLLDSIRDLNLHPEIRGDKDGVYVLGVDPATSYNSCGFAVMKLKADTTDVVYVEAISNTSYPHICSRILEFMTNFNIVRIGLDAGAGKPVLDMFAEGRNIPNKDGSEVMNVILLPVDDETGKNGQRIIHVVQASSPSVTEINFSMKAAMESEKIHFPGIAGEAEGKMLEEKEKIIDNVRQLEAEFRMVEATQTQTGWYSFKVPAHKNKDRYSATLFAFSAAKDFLQRSEKVTKLGTGFWGRRIRL